MKTISIKKNYLNAIRFLSSATLLFILLTVFSGCPKSTKFNQASVQFDSTSYKDSITKVSDSIYSLTAENQINIYGATVDGATFYNACKNIDMLFFVYPKSSNYSIYCASISAGAVSVVALSANSSPQTIPSAPAQQKFTTRAEKISIDDLNTFFQQLKSVDGYDFIDSSGNYIVNFQPDTVIQTDQLGRYFDIYLTVSPKSNPSIQSAARGRVNPCPPCY